LAHIDCVGVPLNNQSIDLRVATEFRLLFFFFDVLCFFRKLDASASIAVVLWVGFVGSACNDAKYSE